MVGRAGRVADGIVARRLRREGAVGHRRLIEVDPCPQGQLVVIAILCTKTHNAGVFIIARIGRRDTVVKFDYEFFVDVPEGPIDIKGESQPVAVIVGDTNGEFSGQRQVGIELTIGDFAAPRAGS